MISKVVTNGCSWMAGMGCRAKPSADGTGTRRDISSLFANKYMADDINLSIGGGSNPRIIRTSIDWLQQNKNKINYDEVFVLIGLTEPYRTELWQSDSGIPGDGYWARCPRIGADNLHTIKGLRLERNSFTSWPSDRWSFEEINRHIIELVSIFEYFGVKYLITDAIAQLNKYHINIIKWDKIEKRRNFRDYKYDESWRRIWDMETQRDRYDGEDGTNRNTVGFDVHYRYNKRSLAELFDDNPNVYLDVAFRDIITNPSLAAQDDYGINDKGEFFAGHPNHRGHRLWYEHLVKYIKKNNII
tara:strand:- start:2455 stop:3357 length:903 start_codon:yes stop_codon:yes gene_type:complete